jgi:hypothetical protein
MGLMDDIFNGGQGRAEADRAAAIGRDNTALMTDLKAPTINWENYNPEMINPDTIDYKTISEDPAVRNMQMRSLAQLAGLAEDGTSAQDELGYQKARELGSQQARAGTQAAIADANNRGVGGSGLEFAMREIANQGGAQSAQTAALTQAADSARQRALYEQAYNSALGSQRSQDLDLSKSNTDIINNYNAANTNIKNSANQTNTTARNAAQQYNQEGARTTQQQNYDNEFKRRQAISGAATGEANTHLANSAAANGQANALFGAATNIASGGVSSMLNSGSSSTAKKANQAGGDDLNRYSAYV